MLGPVMNFPLAFVPFHEAGVDQGIDQGARLAVPVRFLLDIGVSQAGKVAGPALLTDPQEQADKRPASVSAKESL